MFAHVVTAQAAAEDFEQLTGFVRDNLPGIPQQPGFGGFYLFRDPDSDRLMTISLWETEQDLQASLARAAGQAGPGTGLTNVRTGTYEVTLSA